MVTMDIMARDPLMLCLLFLLPSWVWLLPSLDMAIMVMDMVMDMAMDMDMVTMDTMARDLLSQDMDTMVMDMDMDMVMAMVMDTTAKLICCSFSEFSTNEVGPYGTSQKHTIFISKKINIEKRKKK